MSFINKYPKLVHQFIGFLSGLMIAGVLWYSFGQTADIYKEQITKLERKLVIAEFQHEELQTAHKELKTTFNESFKEVTKPDGTKVVTRITNNTADSVSSESSNSSTNSTTRTEVTAAETAARESIRKDLSLYLSIDTDLDVGFDGYYRVFPPFSLGLGIDVNMNNPSEIKELRFGIGISL